MAEMGEGGIRCIRLEYSGGMSLCLWHESVKVRDEVLSNGHAPGARPMNPISFELNCHARAGGSQSGVRGPQGVLEGDSRGSLATLC